MLGWMNHRLESKFLGEISTTSAMQIIKKMKIMASGTTTVKQIEGEIVADFTFLGDPKLLQMVIGAMKIKDTHSLEEKL